MNILKKISFKILLMPYFPF